MNKDNTEALEALDCTIEHLEGEHKGKIVINGDAFETIYRLAEQALTQSLDGECPRGEDCDLIVAYMCGVEDEKKRNRAQSVEYIDPNNFYMFKEGAQWSGGREQDWQAQGQKKYIEQLKKNGVKLVRIKK